MIFVPKLWFPFIAQPQPLCLLETVLPCPIPLPHSQQRAEAMSPFGGQVLDIQAQLKRNQVAFEHITSSFLPLDLFPPPLPVPSLSHSPLLSPFWSSLAYSLFLSSLNTGSNNVPQISMQLEPVIPLPQPSEGIHMCQLLRAPFTSFLLPSGDGI